MSIKLEADTAIEITKFDLCAILTEYFTDSYGPFRKLVVHEVTESDIADEFRILLSPAPTPAPKKETV